MTASNRNAEGESFLGSPEAVAEAEEIEAYHRTRQEHLSPELAKLVGRAQTKTKAWRPEPDDTIAGVVVDITEGESEYGTYPIVELDVADGEVVLVHAFHTILKSEIERKAPRPGDLVAIHYFGREGKNDMARYSLAIERKSAALADRVGESFHG